MLEVLLVALVGVGFLLEADGAVGSLGVVGDGEADDVLHAIPEVERQEQHLQLLAPVDVLVTVLDVGVLCVLSHKDEGPDGDGLVAGEGDDVVSYYYHIFVVGLSASKFGLKLIFRILFIILSEGRFARN